MEKGGKDITAVTNLPFGAHLDEEELKNNLFFFFFPSFLPEELGCARSVTSANRRHEDLRYKKKKKKCTKK